MDIDLVITYVDSSDRAWMKQHREVCEKAGRDVPASPVRYRSWNTLKYIFRGVEQCMPWIRRIHLIVERESQVPKWVRRDRVNVVLHPFIIPREYLPTYNSTCIEMFMYRIPGLAEHFLYANDDMIPLNPLQPSDFYDADGNPRLSRKDRPYTLRMGLYAHHLHNGEAVVRRLLSMRPRRSGITRTGHNIAPMLVSTWAHLWDNVAPEIKRSLSTFRNARNINQELAAYWHLLTDNYTAAERTAKYMDFADVGKVCETIVNTDAQLICINDNKCDNYKYAKRKVTEAFEKKFPDKSRYEL